MKIQSIITRFASQNIRWLLTTGKEYIYVTEFELISVVFSKCRKFTNHSSEFTLAETLMSSYDLKQAAKKFKFCLTPKVTSC